jgi:hypothetical protein
VSMLHSTNSCSQTFLPFINNSLGEKLLESKPKFKTNKRTKLSQLFFYDISTVQLINQK